MTITDNHNSIYVEYQGYSWERQSIIMENGVPKHYIKWLRVTVFGKRAFFEMSNNSWMQDIKEDWYECDEPEIEKEYQKIIREEKLKRIIK